MKFSGRYKHNAYALVYFLSTRGEPRWAFSTFRAPHFTSSAALVCEICIMFVVCCIRWCWNFGMRGGQQHQRMYVITSTGRQGCRLSNYYQQIEPSCCKASLHLAKTTKSLLFDEVQYPSITSKPENPIAPLINRSPSNPKSLQWKRLSSSQLRWRQQQLLLMKLVAKSLWTHCETCNTLSKNQKTRCKESFISYEAIHSFLLNLPSSMSLTKLTETPASGPCDCPNRFGFETLQYTGRCQEPPWSWDSGFKDWLGSNSTRWESHVTW